MDFQALYSRQDTSLYLRARNAIIRNFFNDDALRRTGRECQDFVTNPEAHCYPRKRNEKMRIRIS